MKIMYEMQNRPQNTVTSDDDSMVDDEKLRIWRKRCGL